MRGQMSEGIRKPSRISIVISTAFFAGGGQLMQRRWLAGTVYGGLCMLCFTGVVAYSLVIIVSLYSFGLDPDSVESAPDLGPAKWRMIVALLSSLLVYAINVIDVFRGHRRLCTKWALVRRSIPMYDEGETS